jgi:hypothetical protein
MGMDVPKRGHAQQDEDLGNHSHPINPEEGSRVNRTVSEQEETTMPKRSHTTTLEQPEEGKVEYVTR